MKVVLYAYRGQRWLLAELAKITGIAANTINARIAAGWTIEQAVETPTPKQRRAGVVSNLPAFLGTGDGGTAQETPNITFSGNDA